MKSGYQPVVFASAAEIAAGSLNALPGVRVVIVDTNDAPTGEVREGQASGAPLITATSASVAAALAAIVIADWAAGVAVVDKEARRATATAGTIELGDLIRSNSARTTGATFDATEAGNWTEFSPDIVTSVAGRTGAVSLAKGDVGLGSADNTADSAKPVSTQQQTALDAKSATSHTHAADATKQDVLVSGTNIRSVNGSSLLGSSNLTIAADLPGGATQTITNEGLATTGAPTSAVVGADTVLTFNASGTFTPPLGVANVRVLVVAGGAGGGVGVGGGGGAGGVVPSSSVSVSGSTTVTIGNGGAGRSGDGAGTNGGNSVFGSVTATGGGGGGGWTAAGVTGGSGGGGNSGNGATVAAAGTGTTGQGNTGGVGVITITNGLAGGGGGGGGAVGAAGGTAQADGVGGVGVSNDITGAAIFYGGGGGAGLYVTGATTTARLGGNGGGGTGNSTSAAATAGTVNTGGGGGGAQGFASAAGGSGVVIIRFLTQTRSYQALTSYVDNAAALAAGRLVGQFYKLTANGSVQQVI